MGAGVVMVGGMAAVVFAVVIDIEVGVVEGVRCADGAAQNAAQQPFWRMTNNSR
jgi:hypothetical protein